MAPTLEPKALEGISVLPIWSTSLAIFGPLGISLALTYGPCAATAKYAVGWGSLSHTSLATVCLLLGRAMAQQPNIHKIPHSSLYSWTMYINKKIRCCHLMQFPCYKVACAGNSTSSFSISAILHSCIFGYSCFLSANISIITWHPSIIFVGLSWFVSIGMHLGIFSAFYPTCLYLGEKHVSWSTCFHTWHVSAILFVFMPCPEPPMGISGVGSFPVQSGGSLIFFWAL